MALIGLKFKCFINMCVHVFMCEFHIYSKSKGKKQVKGFGALWIDYVMKAIIFMRYFLSLDTLIQRYYGYCC